MQQTPEIITSKLPTWNLQHKRIFLRADLNVPLYDSNIADDSRLRSILPTLDTILQNGGTVILATHLGRPKQQSRNLSTRIIATWLQEQGYHVHLEPDLEKAHMLSEKRTHSIILLENLRFFPGEKKQDPEFAQKLKSLADVYVNDAFGVAHRNDSSITLLPMLFETDKRTIGLLMEHELKTLAPIRAGAARPYTIILGGGKIKDKLPYIAGFLGKASNILLCPALDFSFMHTLDIPTGKSIVDKTISQELRAILKEASAMKTEIIMPIDYLVARGSINGPLTTVDAENIPADAYGISIGPKTIKKYTNYFSSSQTVVFNAAMGFMHRPETRTGTNDLLQAVAKSNCYSIVGGGDSVAALKNIHAQEKINVISTGGGSMLAYLSGEELPGLTPFLPQT